MTMSIGPITGLPEPQSMGISGERVTIKSFYEGTSVAARAASRDQLRGLVEPGQPPIIPFAHSTDPSVDGYYRIVGLNLSADPMAYVAAGWFDYSLEMERLPGGNALPWVESILLGGYRPNTVSVANTSHAANAHNVGTVDPLAWWSYPAVAIDIEPTVATTYAAAAYDTIRVTGWPGGYKSLSIPWSVAASGFYSGGCEVEQKIGSTWMRVVGRSPIVRTPGNLRISNGYMGVTFDDAASSGSAGVQFHGFGRTAGVLDWTKRGGFMQWGYVNALGSWVDAPVITAISVLRNDPEEVRVKLTCSNGSARGAFPLTVSLRRGSDHVTVTYQNSPTSSFYSKGGFKFDKAAVTAITDISTYGAYKTTASSGIQPWVTCTVPVTTDNTNGLVDPTSSLGVGDVTVWGLGPVYEAYVDNADNGSAMRWFAPFTEKQIFVGR